MSHRTCSVDGCENKFHSKTFCSKHYTRWKRHGDPLYEAPTPECKIEGCEKKFYALDVCLMHYKRWTRHGSYENPRKRNTCKVEECDRGAYGDGYCQKHYQRVKHHGTPDLLPKGRKVCIIDGCDKFRVGHGWCSKHYTRWERYGDPEYRIAGEIINGKKICPRCRQDLPMDEYYSYGSIYCADCARARAREWQGKNPRLSPRYDRTCFTCREEFRGTKRNWVYCSRDCADTGRHQRNYPHYTKRKFRFLLAKKEYFHKIEIFERDNWTCGICDEPIDRTAKFPEPLSASIDHIIPLSRGGDHTRKNVQTAHLGCNVSKGARMPGDPEGETWQDGQLSLF